MLIDILTWAKMVSLKVQRSGRTQRGAENIPRSTFASYTHNDLFLTLWFLLIRLFIPTGPQSLWPPSWACIKGKTCPPYQFLHGINQSQQDHVPVKHKPLLLSCSASPQRSCLSLEATFFTLGRKTCLSSWLLRCLLTISQSSEILPVATGP